MVQLKIRMKLAGCNKFMLYTNKYIKRKENIEI